MVPRSPSLYHLLTGVSLEGPARTSQGQPGPARASQGQPGSARAGHGWSWLIMASHCLSWPAWLTLCRMTMRLGRKPMGGKSGYNLASRLRVPTSSDTVPQGP